MVNLRLFSFWLLDFVVVFYCCCWVFFLVETGLLLASWHIWPRPLGVPCRVSHPCITPAPVFCPFKRQNLLISLPLSVSLCLSFPPILSSGWSLPSPLFHSFSLNKTTHISSVCMACPSHPPRSLAHRIIIFGAVITMVVLAQLELSEIHLLPEVVRLKVCAITLWPWMLDL